MEFTKPSDIGLFDGFTEWYHFAGVGLSIIVGIGLIVLIIRFFDFKDLPQALAALFLIGMTLIFMGFSLFGGNNTAKIESRNANISKVFQIPEDQKYQILGNGIVEDDVFADVKTTIKDADAQVMYEVTFGFKESGEPFIYETGEVNKEFIDNLKK